MDNIFEMSSNLTGELRIDEAMAYECEIAALESFIAMDSFDIAVEGYNWDKRKEWKTKHREIKDLVKAAKNAAKEGNVAEAKSKMAKATSELEKYKADFVKAVEEEQGAAEAICGYFAYGWRGFGLGLLAALPTFGIGYYAVQIKHAVEFWVDLIQVITKKTDRKASDFNMYTKSMEHNMDIMISHYKSVTKKIVGKAEKNAGKSAE